MAKWIAEYVVVDSNGSKTSKDTEVYGVSYIEAYFNAHKLLSLLEKNKTIIDLKVNPHRKTDGKN